MELLLATALLSVVAAIGLPTVFHNFTQRSRDQMIDSVIVELEYTRSMGLMNFEDYSTFKTTEGEQIFIAASQTRRLDGNAFFSNTAEITFDELGRPDPDASNELSLRLADGTTIGTIEVLPAGLIRRK